MATKDTISLLKECDAGVKMATASLEDVMKRVTDPKLHKLLQESRQSHEIIQDEIHQLLGCIGTDEKEPNPIALSMSAMKTGIKLGLDTSDQTVADLITDGCGMGIKSLHKYLNQYQNAEAIARAICRTLIAIEEQLVCDIKIYL